MIQRAQSVYLFFAAILLIATSFFPVIGFWESESVYQTIRLYPLGEYFLLPGFILPALACLAGILSLITIFLYKKRKTQIKLCYSALVLIVLLYGSIYYSYTVIASKLGDSIIKFFPKITLAFPFIAFVLVCMAIGGIIKDDKLVSSLNRIR